MGDEAAPYWLLWEELIVGGAHWSGQMRRGMTLRLTDILGGANASVLLFRDDERLERYNMPDTLNAQHTAYLTKGYVCYSDMGRILCSVVDDTCGWHDTICGVSNAHMVAERYGFAPYQACRNDFYKNGYDSLLIELGKYGLGRRDLGAPINFFSKATVGEEGGLQFQLGNSSAGAYVDLRFEMNTLVVLSTCPHPLDPNRRYRPRDVRLNAWNSGPAPKNDKCRKRCPENERGFRNTEMLYR